WCHYIVTEVAIRRPLVEAYAASRRESLKRKRSEAASDEGGQMSRIHGVPEQTAPPDVKAVYSRTRDAFEMVPLPITVTARHAVRELRGGVRPRWPRKRTSQGSCGGEGCCAGWLPVLNGYRLCRRQG